MMEVVLGPIPAHMAAAASSGVRDLFKRCAKQGQPVCLHDELAGRLDVHVAGGLMGMLLGGGGSWRGNASSGLRSTSCLPACLSLPCFRNKLNWPEGADGKKSIKAVQVSSRQEPVQARPAATQARPG